MESGGKMRTAASANGGLQWKDKSLPCSKNILKTMIFPAAAVLQHVDRGLLRPEDHITSIVDLDLFIRSLKHGKLLSAEMSEEMFKPQTSIAKAFEWGKIINGFGCHFFFDTVGNLIRMYKEGQCAGVAAMAAYYPDSDTTSIVLANQTCNVWELHWKAEQILLSNH